MRSATSMLASGLALVLCGTCHPQAIDRGGPEELARSLVEAINGRSLERRVAILHPATRACMTPETDAYFSWIFSRQLKYTIPQGKYKTLVEPVAAPMDLNKLLYPVRPSHLLRLDFETAPHSSTTLVLQIARHDGRWYEVLACPGPELVAGAQRSQAETERQEKRAQEVLSSAGESLRAEVAAMAKDGRRVDAIRKVAAATGEDLAVARRVVELLVEAGSSAMEPKFVSDSKLLGAPKTDSGNPRMDLVMREVERRPAVSVLNIETNVVGSTVGSSFFLLCSVRELAKLRGDYRFIVKVEKHGRPAQWIVGFLASRNDSLEGLGPEFRHLRSPQDIIDLEQYAPICQMMK
ncbi:MAG: hypothetical protein HZB13_18065 [Acidobacteria bacterium]|nr:hypothetical protein [Acidobacteriota bacterium]